MDSLGYISRTMPVSEELAIQKNIYKNHDLKNKQA
jgi:hypothetical protein